MMSPYLVFLFLLGFGAITSFLAFRLRTVLIPSGNNPTFLKFQRGFFAAYLIALVADWLQSPYKYKLYSYYGFEEEQIAVLYVCGFASTVLLGSWASVAADRFGRKKLCITFAVIYSVSCILKLSGNYWVLLFSCILGGIATSLLFSAFEAWYVHEHVETFDFPKEWIQANFEKVTVWNGYLAIAAGILANVFVEWLHLSPVAPFLLAVPCLIIVAVIITTQWNENYCLTKTKLKKSCMDALDGLSDIFKEPKIFLVGIIQSLFESAMYIFVFIWTPVLDRMSGVAPLGIIFACFMVCIVIGTGIFQILHRNGVPVVVLLTCAVFTAFLANVVCMLASHPDNDQQRLCFLAFLFIEISVGIYFKAMTIVRSTIVPDATRAAINNWFRVPLNLIACVILMMLHNDFFRHGNRLIFISCSILLALASLGVVKFADMMKDDPAFQTVQTEQPAVGENGNN